MPLARHYNTYLTTRGNLFVISYKHGSITVTSRDRANALFDKLKVL